MSKRGAHARETGLAVEEAACGHLRSCGYEIAERNYACRYGEIDIVAWDSGTLVFVEVRYRGWTSSESPGESLTWKKVMRMRRAVRDYLFRRAIRDSVPVRVDACLAYPAVTFCRTKEPAQEAIGVPGLGFIRFEVVRGAVDFG